MKYQIQFSPISRSQILEALEYIRTDQQAPINAARWLEGIIEAISGLATFPMAHEQARESREFEEDLRQYVFQSHRIVFDVVDNVVRVHQVIHVARRNISGDELNLLTPKT